MISPVAGIFSAAPTRIRNPTSPGCPVSQSLWNATEPPPARAGGSFFVRESLNARRGDAAGHAKLQMTGATVNGNAAKR